MFPKSKPLSPSNNETFASFAPRQQQRNIYSALPRTSSDKTFTYCYVLANPTRPNQTMAPLRRFPPSLVAPPGAARCGATAWYACVATQEPTGPVKFMGRPKNSQSDCMQNDRESQYNSEFCMWSLSTRLHAE